MELPRTYLLALISCLPAAPLLAQTQIGGGSCSSATLNGTFDLSITGRQVTVSGSFNNVFQATGYVSFDGLSKFTASMVEKTVQNANTPLNWSGTYSMQANCAGVITITTGGSATFNLEAYANGADFLMTGSDATYSYSGSGNTQPTNCSSGTLNGVYTINATGWALSSSGVVGATDAVGLLSFDGQSNLTVNLTIAQNGAGNSTSTFTGSYSVASSCLGTATLSDGKGHTYVVNISMSNATVDNAAFDISIAGSGNFMLLGTGHVIYGQPPATAELGLPGSTKGGRG